MKGIFKTGAILTLTGMLGACSSMTTIAERDTYAEPKWYADCAQSGTEGLLWWTKEYAYACGGGESTFFQGAEEQMYTIAMNNFAKRINGVVNSKTEISINNDTRNTSTKISYSVKDTAITQHLEEERVKFKYAGKYYSFVKLKMPREVFDALLNESTIARAN